MKKILIKGWLAIVLCFGFCVSYTQPNITRVEYYVDADPGYGNGTSIPITPGDNLADKTFNLDPSAFTPGVHILCIRAKDANGAWSQDNKWAFVKAYPALPGNSALTNITRVEYYVDTDPGYGNATNIGITPGTNLSDITFNLDPANFISGVHQVCIRAKDGNGAWSQDQRWLFLKAFNSLNDTDNIPLLSQVEYYIDTDPGYGKGIPVAIPVSKNLVDVPISTNITGLAAGDHILFIRSKDGNGAWSQDNTFKFTVAALIATPSITVNSITAKTSNCARDSFDISYHVTGTYNAGNVFNVQLSDATGNFTSPIAIGSYTGTGNSIIKVKLLSHLPDGTGYKVRVNSTNPVVTGSASTVTINIHDRPNAPIISGATDANNTFSYAYSIPAVTGSSWKWIAPSATITQTANNASLKWNIAGLPDTIQAIETNQYGCVGDTGILKVNVYDLQIDQVASSSLTPCPLGTITVTGNATGVYDATNKFTTQLSDASGSFSSPVNIGSVTVNPVGVSQAISINATLPFPLANGTGYRVRIISSSPSVTGSDNGQNIIINKPGLGADQTVKKCPGFTTDISAVFTTAGLTVEWNTTTPTAVETGVYTLIVTNENGCKDTANVTVSDYPKPHLGADKSITIRCANGTADLTTVYNITGLTAVYSAAIATAAPAGIYAIIVTNANGCKDTANITVLDASTATVPSSGSNIKTANRECSDAQGWTHYYNDNGTPSDYSDDIRLLSLKKNGNNIGTVGVGAFQVKVAATNGAGSGHGVKITTPLVQADTTFYSMNRYWDITPTSQPSTSVGVRFYYNGADVSDVQGNFTEGSLAPDKLIAYKLQGGNPDPTSNWEGATGNHFYSNGATPGLQTWTYNDLGDNHYQAEFVVSTFSGGGLGIISRSVLPVTFVSFNVVAQKDKVFLQWTTATEANSKDFKVQRSLDGTNFETIGTIAAAGSSSNLRNYQFEDPEGISLKGKMIFYRIMQTDRDGQMQYTAVKTLKIPGNQNRFTLAYNPVKDEALLRYDCVENAKVKIRVVDHLGRLVSVIEQSVQPGMNEIRLSTGNLPKGIYEVELRSNKDQGHVRMMKE